MTTDASKGTSAAAGQGMKRTFTLILAALAAAALFGGLVYAVLVAAHVSEPAATTVYGLTPRRFWGHVSLYVLLLLTALQIAWHFLKPRATESRLFRRTKWRKSRQSSIFLGRIVGVVFMRVNSKCAHHCA